MKVGNRFIKLVLIAFPLFLSRDEIQVKCQLLPKYNPLCGPNPPSLTAAQLSAPFATCDKTTKKSLAQRHPDQNRNTAEVLQAYKYPYREYNVTTKDGYILKVYRIMGSPNLKKQKKKKNQKKQSVFVQHGLSAASDCWMFQPGSRNLPFKLADAGYEVWLGNSRGVSYSLGHKKYYSNKDLKYWDFSWHEMGIYDVPAVTDMILSETKNKKIFYVGHSMGTTQYFVALSEIPKMNNKFLAGFMFAPIGYTGHTNNPARVAFPLIDSDLKYKVVNLALQGRLQSAQKFRTQFKLSPGDACDLTATKCGLCDNLLFLLFGYDAQQMNNTELPNIIAKIPNNISVKTLAHYAQIGTSCKFTKYDYGPIVNQKIYKSATPPLYKLENIKVPTYFYYGVQDNLGPPNDVNITASKFSKGVIKVNHKIDSKYWNHIDFIMAKDADKLLYNLVLKEMQKIKK